MTVIGAARTHPLGLIGSDISLSRTPPMHRAEGLAQGHATVYRRIDTATPALADAPLSELLEPAVWLSFVSVDGLNNTHPCKQEVLGLLDGVDERPAHGARSTPSSAATAGPRATTRTSPASPAARTPGAPTPTCARSCRSA